MKDDVVRTLQRYQKAFAAFTPGQKAVALVGTAALLLAGVMVFRMVSTPSYSPLFSNLSAADASAVVDKLDAQGVPYQITNGGSTIMVPQNDVYKTRITLSGAGLPAASDGTGYSLLDSQGLSTSQFQEQTDFKRAMEGELAKTVEALDGVQTAVVHLALPQQQVFADKQPPATASVLVATTPGVTLTPEQVQSVVHLVASSIDGLSPNNVTVADSTGTLLSSNDVTGGAAGAAASQEVDDYQNQMTGKVQSLLDRVVGPNNASAQVTAVLNFDQTSTTTRTYKNVGIPLSAAKSSETYKGPAGGSGVTGVVGPDGQMGSTGLSGSGASTYVKKAGTSDNALDSVVEHRQAAPGGVQSLHIGVVLDQKAAAATNPAEIQRMIASALGINPKRGDTVRVSVLPFDRTAENAAAAQLKAAAAADATAKQWAMYRNIGIGVAVLGALLLLWLRGRKRSQARQEATTYVVEQLRRDAATRAVELDPPTALLSLESIERNEQEAMRRELTQLVENQPEDVAALLRGWLVER